eukprot:gb/GECG01010360.1/.p1 GENE.gb/GECG01010360.1/~~gb/GECG01010360.1/.p1  ORF type:complete len:892 (+),score=125.72 gb/GECG01010360.1/:1-2676(+)
MQRECFQDPDIAKVLNENCVSIKVDREERPDVDDYYIRATEPFGTGGWPLSVFLSPELHIITAGTYIPPNSKMGMKSFPEVCELVSRIWQQEPEKIKQQGDQIQQLIQEHMKSVARGELADASAVQTSDLQRIADEARGNLYNSLYQRFDSRFGGFQDAPKFPRPVEPVSMFNIAVTEGKRSGQVISSPSPLKEISQYVDDRHISLKNFTYHANLRMEMENALRRNGFSLPKSEVGTSNSLDFKIGNFSKAEKALGSAWFTLRRMIAGGIHDHVAGGFHRYAVDSRWIVPHFEKMLYDQSGIALSLLDGYLLTGDTTLAHAARSTLDFVRREMTNEEGGIIAALDADSAEPGTLLQDGTFSEPSNKSKREGAFYVWTYDEIDNVLDYFFDIKQKTNSVAFLKECDNSLPAAVDAEMAKEAFKLHYSITNEGNAHDRSLNPHGELDHQNVIIAQGSLDSTLEVLRERHPDGWSSMSEAEGREKLAETLSKCREGVRVFRQEMRPYPHIDEKVVTAWNGLMMAAFSRGAQILPLEVAREGIYARLHNYQDASGAPQAQYVYTPASEYLPPARAVEINTAGQRMLEAFGSASAGEEVSKYVPTMVAKNTREYSKYVDAAKGIAEFVWNELTFEESKESSAPRVRLLRSHCGDASQVAAFAEDYSAFIHGLIELYQACGEIDYLHRAVDLQHVQNELFWDPDNGGYFSTSADTGGNATNGGDSYKVEHFAPVRSKPFHDGAEPCANSLGALNLLALAALTGDAGFGAKADQILKLFQSTVQSKPIIMPLLYTAYDIVRDASHEAVTSTMTECMLSGSPEDVSTRSLMHAVFSRYDKSRVVGYADGGVGQEFLQKNRPELANMGQKQSSPGASVAYICKNRTCSKPESDPLKLVQS